MFDKVKCGLGIHKWSEWVYVSDNSCDLIRHCMRCPAEETKKGEHAWGEWDYVSDNSCDLIRHCTHCPAEETKKGEHAWGEWDYVSDNSCDLIRHCMRCPAEDKKKGPHTWSKWEYCVEIEKKELLSKKDALSIEDADIFGEYTSTNEDKKKIHKQKMSKEIDNKIRELESKIKQLEESSEPCEQISICKRCSQKQFQTEHKETPPHYISSGSCKIVTTCQNTGCNYQNYIEEKHIWGCWQYESPDSCIQVRYCTRCPNSERTSEEKHIWDEWQAGLIPLDPCLIARRCEHCRRIEKSSDYQHSWGEWQIGLLPLDPCRISRRCEHDGKIEQKNEYHHSWGEWVECDARDGNIIYNRRKTCSRCTKDIYGNEHEGIILTSSFFDNYRDIADYIVNFNKDYAKKHKKEIVNAIRNVAEFNNERYPLLEIESLPGFTQIVKMLQDSSEEDIRIASIKAIMIMRRPADPKSEAILTTQFNIALTDSSKKLRILAKSYLE